MNSRRARIAFIAVVVVLFGLILTGILLSTHKAENEIHFAEEMTTSSTTELAETTVQSVETTTEMQTTTQTTTANITSDTTTVTTIATSIIRKNECPTFVLSQDYLGKVYTRYRRYDAIDYQYTLSNVKCDYDQSLHELEFTVGGAITYDSQEMERHVAIHIRIKDADGNVILSDMLMTNDATTGEFQCDAEPLFGGVYLPTTITSAVDYADCSFYIEVYQEAEPTLTVSDTTLFKYAGHFSDYTTWEPSDAIYQYLDTLRSREFHLQDGCLNGLFEKNLDFRNCDETSSSTQQDNSYDEPVFTITHYDFTNHLEQYLPDDIPQEQMPTKISVTVADYMFYIFFAASSGTLVNISIYFDDEVYTTLSYLYPEIADVTEINIGNKA